MLPAFRVELKVFTGFVFKLVFRISGSEIGDLPVTSNHTDTDNLQVLPVKAY